MASAIVTAQISNHMDEPSLDLLSIQRALGDLVSPVGMNIWTRTWNGTNVRFIPKSGHVQCNSPCPLWAKSGHLRCEKKYLLYPRKKSHIHRRCWNLSTKNRHGEPAERCQLKPFNVGACHDGIAGRSGRDPDHVDFVRYSAVRMFPHVCHHRGDRLAYLADPETRARALLATLNVLFSCHPR